MPQIVMAFDSDCSEKTLSGWFTKERGLQALCVIRKYIMMRDPNTDKVETMRADANHEEILHFVSKVYTTILQSHRELKAASIIVTTDGSVPGEPDIGSYLTFDMPFRDLESPSQ
jgi:hypothetical protein